MRPDEWAAIALGTGAIAWINWYFFLADRGVADVTRPASAQAHVGHASPATVNVMVKGGYSPGTIRVSAGQPVRLIFDRQETSSCSEEIVFPDFNIRKFLPPFQQTTVEVTPPKAGKYEFTCGMSMLHGTLIAE